MLTCKRASVLLVTVLVSTCGGGGSPSEPSNTRVIGLSGNLGFGTVSIGQEATASLTIRNTGNDALTITGMRVPSGGVYFVSWTNGTIPPAGSQQVTVYFAPTAATSYNGTFTVNGDQTSGTNTMAISGTGRAKILSAEEVCATIPSIGFGNFFYCATNQTNLQRNNFPDGSLGFCHTAAANNLGLVGYVAITADGGIGKVETQAQASASCNLFPRCVGYIRCTRL